jgi:hypothetical protein
MKKNKRHRREELFSHRSSVKAAGTRIKIEIRRSILSVSEKFHYKDTDCGETHYHKILVLRLSKLILQ